MSKASVPVEPTEDSRTFGDGIGAVTQLDLSFDLSSTSIGRRTVGDSVPNGYHGYSVHDYDPNDFHVY